MSPPLARPAGESVSLETRQFTHKPAKLWLLPDNLARGHIIEFRKFDLAAKLIHLPDKQTRVNAAVIDRLILRFAVAPVKICVTLERVLHRGEQVALECAAPTAATRAKKSELSTDNIAH